MADADKATKDLILKLASDPASVRVDKHAAGNMQAWDLTLDDVREAICRHIKDGERVKLTTVKRHPPGMVGQPA